MKDLTEGKLADALIYATSINDDSLQKCIDRLRMVEKNLNINEITIETLISTDFAPYSFEFARYNMPSGKFNSNGGIIFHGTHDNGGDGGAPTFSVNLTPTSGWQIHT